MSEVEIIDTNADNICNYGFCAYKNIKQEGYKRKTDWLKQRFPEGMRFKVLHSTTKGDVGIIEYIPGEYTWRAIEASGYMVIHCILNIYHKYRNEGYGSLLLNECFQDAKKQNMLGVAAVTSKGPWMAGKDLFLKNGLEVADEYPPHFELLVKKFKNAASPKFKKDYDKKLSQYDQGLTIIHSDQCPYVVKAINEIGETINEYGISANFIELKDCADAQNTPTPYGIFSIIYNGKLLIDHGLDDPLIPVDGTIDYYERMCRSHAGKENVDKFCRLYLPPGDGHGNCFGNGPGITETDGMRALVNWVETGLPPGALRVVQVKKLSGHTICEHEQQPY